MALGTSSLPSDSWNQPHILSTSHHRVTSQARVPDDWDDDDDDEPVTEEVNKRIWEDANAKAPNPMPELIIAPSATSSNHVIPPPPAAFQPTMRILKRPDSDASSKPATPPPSAESLKQREARYQAARERIFGSDSGASTPLSEELTVDSTSSCETVNLKDRRERTKVSPPSTAIVRHPRGPTTDSTDTEQTPPRGFDGQRTKRLFPHSSSQTTTES